LEGIWSTLVQHEIDHLNGVLFIDYLSRLKRDMIVKKFTKLKRTDALEPTDLGGIDGERDATAFDCARSRRRHHRRSCRAKAKAASLRPCPHVHDLRLLRSCRLLGLDRGAWVSVEPVSRR